MRAQTRLSKWLGVGALLVMLLLSFTSVIEARNHVVLNQDTSVDVANPTAPAPAAPHIAPIVKAPIDWFNGPFVLPPPHAPPLIAQLRCLMISRHELRMLTPFDAFAGISPKYQRLVTIIFCVVAMLIGVFFIIFGYRIFRVCIHTFSS